MTEVSDEREALIEDFARGIVVAKNPPLEVCRQHMREFAERWVALTAAAALTALVAERDDARERTNAAIEDYNNALAAIATANARIAGLEKALAEVRGHIADVAVAGMLIGDGQAETHTRLREKGKAMLAIVDAALTGVEDA